MYYTSCYYRGVKTACIMLCRGSPATRNSFKKAYLTVDVSPEPKLIDNKVKLVESKPQLAHKHHSTLMHRCSNRVRHAQYTLDHEYNCGFYRCLRPTIEILSREVELLGIIKTGHGNQILMACQN